MPQRWQREHSSSLTTSKIKLPHGKPWRRRCRSAPSLAFAYTMGAIVSGWGGAAERAIEWGEQALRLSPLDPHAFGAWHGLGIGFFIKGHYEDAASAERRAIQRNPGFSVLHLMLAAALVKLGRIDEAKTAAERVLTLEPGFTIAELCAANEPAPAIAVPLTEALRAAGLPE